MSAAIRAEFPGSGCFKFGTIRRFILRTNSGARDHPMNSASESEPGFDDQFNDGVFDVSRRNTRLVRPEMWPKSVSEMRQHTSYDGQGMHRDADVGYSNYMAQVRAGGQWAYIPVRGGWVFVAAQKK
jgi:hypothetical protein